MSIIYFDSAATAIPLPEAVESAKNSIDIYGNPSSVHSAGLTAKKVIDEARKKVATSLFCKPEEIIFTGGGSESNNQAIFGLAKLAVQRELSPPTASTPPFQILCWLSKGKAMK